VWVARILQGASGRLDAGRVIARLVCAVFALVGALPLLAAALVSSGPVKRWAERETTRLLSEEFGVSARYRVELRLLPLRLAVEDLSIPSSDGGEPALRAEAVTVVPRIFSLLGGRLDLGEIELERPRARLVLKDGKVANLSYRLKPRKGPSGKVERAPFSSLAITEGRFDVELDGTRIKTGLVDLDVFADRGPSFEIALQVDSAEVVRSREDDTILTKRDGSPVPPRPAVDEDVLCRLEARLRLEPGAVAVRRLALLGRADDKIAKGTAPSCTGPESDARTLALRVSQLTLTPRTNAAPLFAGHVVARAPLSLVNRFVRTLPLHGWAGFAGDARFDGSEKLPELEGKLSGDGIAIGPYRLAKAMSADVRIRRDALELPRFEMGFSDGRVEILGGRIAPFEKGVPMKVASLRTSSVAFTSLMRDLNVTPNTIVNWDIRETRAENVSGTLSPVQVGGKFSADTHDFEVFDRAFHKPARQHMIGVKHAVLRGNFRVVPGALEFFDTDTQFGKSSIRVKLVSIGFANTIKLDIEKGSRIDLRDGSPLVDLPMAGLAELDVHMAGEMSNPLLTGNVKIQGFEFGGFPIGDLTSGKVKFRPLYLEVSDLQGQKGKSTFTVPSARIDFDSAATVLADARVKTSSLDIRDFLAMWHFEKDPRWSDLAGKMGAEVSVRYVLGGPEDPCRGGVLTTSGTTTFSSLDLFGEHYDGGAASFRFRWFDREASYHAIEFSSPDIVLRKGSGTMVGSFEMTPGAKVRGHFVATEVPLDKLDALPQSLKVAEGQASGVAEIGGSIDALTTTGTGRLSSVRVGRSTLPPSRFSVELVPAPNRTRVIGKTACGGPITEPFVVADFDADNEAGQFVISGGLFGNQVKFDGLSVTRQRNKIARGNVTFENLDLAAVAELTPTFALSDSRLSGTLSGKLTLAEWRVSDPMRSRATLSLSALSLSRGGLSAELAGGPHRIELDTSALRVPGMAVVATTALGHRATFDFDGSIANLSGDPELEAHVRLRPMELSALTQVFPKIERASGTVTGRIDLEGPLRAPRHTGGFDLTRGEIVLRGFPSPITDLDLGLKLEGNEVSIARGSARIGSGRVSVSGGAPLRGFELGAVRLDVTARELSLPLGDGIRGVADADLLATYRPGAERTLPRITGNVLLRSFEYRRPVTMTADLSALGHRGRRTEFESYDPADDVVELDVTLRAARSLQIRTGVIEADLELEREGLILAGTNGRFGARGTVEVKPGGRITLRRSEFEITQGTVRFDDATRIAPTVDVTAVTDYRRYAGSSTSQGPSAPAGATSTSVSGGNWRIRMHAHGDADNLKIDLTSDPVLAQDDIFLLLTVGLTRAELDQAQSASVGESVALEALGTLSGADRAVTDAVPVIDEFRFGSAYSSRTGRTEPTVTIGKRLTERVRANVTTGIAESREVRSNVEWQLSNRVSVESSYDNVNDISSSALGNLGADVRWRLEFE
jgi:translocation and assembly module TamB